ncbi:MAG: hypothetical protein KKD77_21830 [Gammaproteobacteria bacterium]|nr:hypothetical protein [Gammaproteobacteria bacterium]MBU2249404.1 hypothetical protein [Gammaproteobacteria bacterium]
MNPTKQLRNDLNQTMANFSRTAKELERLKNEHTKLINASVTLENSLGEMTDSVERFCAACSENGAALCQTCLLNKWLY